MITPLATTQWLRARRRHGWHRRSLSLRLPAVLAAGGIGLMLAAGPAGAQPAAAPPEPGATLSMAGAGDVTPGLFYTGADRRVWTADLSLMSQNVPSSLGGQLIGGPSAVWIPPGNLFPRGGLAVFGRGTDNALWWRYQTSSGWSRWASLGGRLTSKPAAAASPEGANLLISARGADGAVWAREEYNRPGLWIGWHKIGGRLLSGTSPAAIFPDGVFITVVGTDRAVWAAEDLPGSPGFVWHSLGGHTSSDPGVTQPTEGAAVAFVRGTDNGGWYNQFFGHTAGVAPGWHSLGGVLTSGMTTFTRQGTPVSVWALGADNQVWTDGGTLPSLTGWHRVPLG